MNRRIKVNPIDIPPGDYSKDDLNKGFSKTNQLIGVVYTPGDDVCYSLTFTHNPGWGYGKPTWGVYVDGNGFLKVARPEDVFAPGFTVRVKLRPVTVAT